MAPTNAYSGPRYNSQAYPTVAQDFITASAYQSPPFATYTQEFTSWSQTVPSCHNQQSMVLSSFKAPTTSYHGNGQPPLNRSTRGIPRTNPTLQTTSDVSYMGEILTPQNISPDLGMAPSSQIYNLKPEYLILTLAVRQPSDQSVKQFSYHLLRFRRHPRNHFRRHHLRRSLFNSLQCPL
jgi:hypothetical protein